jgi:hypothetical protein
MNKRLWVKNPKELSKSAKVFGLSAGDFMLVSLYLTGSPLIKINGFFKLCIPILIICGTKYINRNHPGNLIIETIKSKKKLYWFGAIKKVRK